MFEIKQQTFFNGPSITHKDEHFAKKKNCMKIGWKLKKLKFFNFNDNEQSHQVWFHLVQWFQRRRLKCKSLRTTTRTIDTKWWQYLTCPFGSGEQKQLFYYIIMFKKNVSQIIRIVLTYSKYHIFVCYIFTINN